MGSSEMRCSGFSTTAVSSERRCPSSRSIVGASKRSVLYSALSRSPSASSVAYSVRSCFVVPVWTGSTSIRRPGTSSGGRGAFCRLSITWNSGRWRELRSGLRASTSFSKGTSWWAWASRAVSKARPSSSRNVGSPARLVRSASVLMNRPMRPSSSARSRPATSVPTVRSVCPVVALEQHLEGGQQGGEERLALALGKPLEGLGELRREHQVTGARPGS